MSYYGSTWYLGTLPQEKPTHPSTFRMELSEGFYLTECLMLNPANGLYDRYTPRRTLFAKYNLVDKNILEFVNELCVLVDEKKGTLPEKDWVQLNRSLRELMIRNENGRLLHYLLNVYGAEAINYAAWVHFSIDCDWEVCLDTFQYMPTSVLEDYVVKDWSNRSRNFTEECVESVLEHIAKRDDIYGHKNLPSEFVKGLLFTGA